MELLREHVWRTVMESKQSQFWNAVSVAVFTVLAGILTGYVALLIVGELPGVLTSKNAAGFFYATKSAPAHVISRLWQQS